MMTWKVEFDNRARKELRKLDKSAQNRILKWVREELATDKNPRRTGKNLRGKCKGYGGIGSVIIELSVRFRMN